MIMLTIKHVPVSYPIAKYFFIDTESSNLYESKWLVRGPGSMPEGLGSWDNTIYVSTPLF